jgi:hypothetical protein
LGGPQGQQLISLGGPGAFCVVMPIGESAEMNASENPMTIAALLLRNFGKKIAVQKPRESTSVSGRSVKKDQASRAKDIPKNGKDVRNELM